MSFVWQTSVDNSTWTNMLTPDDYKIDWEDLDKDSYRSVVNGDLIRNVLKRRWSKIALTFKGVSDSECQTLLSSVNRETVYFKMRSPAFGTNNFITFKGYVSKMSAKTDLLRKGWDVSFNIVQEKGASWQ